MEWNEHSCSHYWKEGRGLMTSENVKHYLIRMRLWVHTSSKICPVPKNFHDSFVHKSKALGL